MSITSEDLQVNNLHFGSYTTSRVFNNILMTEYFLHKWLSKRPKQPLGRKCMTLTTPIMIDGDKWTDGYKNNRMLQRQENYIGQLINTKNHDLSITGLQRLIIQRLKNCLNVRPLQQYYQQHPKDYYHKLSLCNIGMWFLSS